MDALTANMPLILFLIVGTIAVASSILVVAMRNPVHSALFLLVTFLCVAMLFIMRNAEFVGAVQVLVYAGGIMVLYILGIMFTDSDVLKLQRQFQLQTWPVLVLVLVLFLWMGHKLYRADYTAQAAPRVVAVSDQSELKAIQERMEKAAQERAQGTNTQRLAGALYGDYLYPFEASSVLLLVAMLGAVFLAKKEV